MNTLFDVLHLNGHGLYVWGSVGMCALVIAGEVLLLERRRRAPRHVADMGDPT